MGSEVPEIIHHFDGGVYTLPGPLAEPLLDASMRCEVETFCRSHLSTHHVEEVVRRI